MSQTAKKYHPGRLYEIPLTEVVLDAEQPRKFFDPQAMAELTGSVQKHGVLQPVLVRLGTQGEVLLVSGERRYQASVAAGRETIPALLTNGDPVEISIVKNLLREGLTAIEEAEAVNRLRDSHNYQLGDLSGVLGKAESTLSEILSLNKLPLAVRDDCRNDPKVSRRVLAEIAKQSSQNKMLAMYDRFKAKGLTRGELRSERATLRQQAQKAAAGNAPAPVDLGFVERFTKYLEKLEVGKLVQPQSRDFMCHLDTLRLALNRKMKQLRAMAEPPEPPKP